ncbi:CS1-pili formation C-terminal domain-containing protein [Moellerella wisconsensis]|uniref:TcfC E-set like domain-containing protein n=1 Tax=Moellerella wisconsensis TaxID=158849 RepID=UPI0025B19D56|nr:CS1-pili formation C-terminal domain-containing protein [Moellerella wisconsensis]WJW83151.1 CS1-pili formation C-terminal domain-containing protein [Moellerella wisconsensis]
MYKKLGYYIFLGFFSITSNAISSPVSSIKIGNNIIPAAFVSALEQGMSVPVFLQYEGSRSQTKIATANISLSDGKLKLLSLDYLDNSQEANLSKDVLESIEHSQDNFFDTKMEISISDNAILHLDILSFNLNLNVTKSAFEAKSKVKNDKLGPSSVENISTVINYDFGAYQNYDKKSKNTNNSYLNIDLLAAFAENHFNINTSAYGIGNSNNKFELYRAMYERDHQGFRFAMGLLSTWNLQSIASLTALSSSKIYGITFGNKSSSLINKSSSSLIPIYIFLPSPGEVRIYRGEKLLNIQNFPMGSFELDTSILPYGIYDVTVETVVDGNVVSTKEQTINKSFGGISANLNRLEWEAYGGYVDYVNPHTIINNREKNKKSYNNVTDKTYLIGFSGATTLDLLSGFNFKVSNYAFDKNIVIETGANLSINKYLSLVWQGLLSNGGTNRNIITASAQIPYSIGSVWASKEKTIVKSDLPIYASDNYSYGASISLNSFIDNAGSFTISQSYDRRTKSKSLNYEYGNNLYNGRYGNIGLRLGVQKYHYDDQENTNEKFIALDFSLPLSTWLSTGVSSSNGNIKGNVFVNKMIDDSFITSAGGSMSKLLRDKNNGESNISTLGYASYETKYNSGTLTVNRPDNRRMSGNYTSRGAFAYSDSLFGVSGKSGRAGVIINPNIKGNGAMTAQINGKNHQLTGNNTFIPLSPYADYKIELMNSGESMDSFDIIAGRNKSVILYPGNIAVYTPNVRQLVTVFGRIKSSDGTLLSDASIHNHIGKTKTDKNGEFSMDVDMRFPIISVINTSNQNSICEADLDLSGAKGALWLGDIICEPQSSFAQR